MPFKPTSSSLAPKPSDVIHVVDVIFRGLLLICPNANGSSCDIGIHRRAAGHYLTIATTRKPLSGDDSVIDFHAGPLDGASLSIDVNPPTGNGVFAYVPTPPPFDRSKNNNDEDLQWALDMQALHGAQFGGQLEVDPTGIHPGITMSDGVFSTALRTSEQDVRLTLQDPSGASSNIHSIAHVIRASIWLRAGQSVHIQRLENGLPKKLDLPMSGDADGTDYEIYVRNDPPGFSSETGHDELEQYYDVLRKRGGGPIGSNERFKLEPTGPRSTDRIPCMPVLFGG